LLNPVLVKIALPISIAAPPATITVIAYKCGAVHFNGSPVQFFPCKRVTINKHKHPLTFALVERGFVSARFSLADFSWQRRIFVV